MRYSRVILRGSILLIILFLTLLQGNARCISESRWASQDFKTYRPILLYKSYLLRIAQFNYVKVINQSANQDDQSTVTTLVDRFSNSLDSALKFAGREKNVEDVQYITRAKQGELKDLNNLKKKTLSKITLWSFREDIKYLDTYQESGDSEYLRASVEDVSTIVVSNQAQEIEEGMVRIRVETVDDAFQHSGIRSLEFT